MALAKLSSWWKKWQAKRRVRSVRRNARLRLEQLEDRCVPSYSITDLATFGGFSSGAPAINASGQVVGDSLVDDSHTHAFLYSGGAMADLGAMGGQDSYARGINASGQVVGYVLTASVHWGPRWPPRVALWTSMGTASRVTIS
jgi:probable HAF family extracellular repeat protein